VAAQERVSRAFTSAKVSHWRCCRKARSNAARVVSMVSRHDAEGFGSCSNEACRPSHPKEISITIYRG
jgi:hypothetical protein